MERDIMECIKSAVVEAGLSQDDVAEAVEVSTKTVWNWFNHKNVMPLDKAVVLADKMGISFDELVGRGKNEQPTGSDLLFAVYERLNDEGKGRMEEYALMLFHESKFTSD